MSGADQPGHRGRAAARAWAATLACALAAMTLAVAAAQPARPLVAAHRGGALLWPENSLTAFRGAVALGADFLETDLHLTADDEVVVIHDPTLDRTTTGTGRVRAARLADLGTVRLRARDGAVTPDLVPTLGQFLDVVGGARLLLEIKVDADRRRYPGIEERVLAPVRARGLADRTVVMAFEPETVRRLRALDPAIPTALLVSKSRVDREAVPAREAVRWAREVGATHLGIDHRVLDAGVLEAARAAGVTVAVWTVNEDPDLRRVIAAGADVVISDRPDLALRLAGR
jgi:glycerophosphoryl diester phosphodiesterase